MITCYLRYVIDPYQLVEFETYAKMWIPLVEKFGGKHHGYFLPSEGANNIALALFSFPSLAAYETYRTDSMKDADDIVEGYEGGLQQCEDASDGDQGERQSDG